MRFLRLLPAFALVLAACSGDSTGARVPASMQIVSGDLQIAPVNTELPDPLVVRVVDDRGRPVRGQIVNFRVVSGGGSVFAGAAETNADGEARERWTVGPVHGDTQRVEVRAVDPTTGQAQTFAVFRAIGYSGPERTLGVVRGPRWLPVGGTDSVVVAVVDALGRPLADAPVTWTVTEGGGTVSLPQTRTGADGTTRVLWTMGNEKPMQWLRASTPIAEPQLIPSEVGTQVLQGLGSGQTASYGSQLADSPKLVVTWEGRPLPGVAVQWLVTQGTSTLVGEAQTDAQGVARAAWTLGGTAPASHRAVARLQVGYEIREVAFTATATGGAPAQLIVPGGGLYPGDCPVPWFGSSPTTAYAAGEVRRHSPPLRVLDARGYPVAGVSVQWSASGNGAALPAVTQTDVGGNTTTAWRLSTTAYTTDSMTATVAGVGSVKYHTTVCYGDPARTFAVPDTILFPGGGFIGVGLRDRFGNNIPLSGRQSFAFTWTSLDSAVAVPVPNGTEPTNGASVEARGVGTTRIIVRYGSTTPDTVVVVVSSMPASRAPAAVRAAPASASGSRGAPLPARRPRGAPATGTR